MVVNFTCWVPLGSFSFISCFQVEFILYKEPILKIIVVEEIIN
jgi:hypothetical protein